MLFLTKPLGIIKSQVMIEIREQDITELRSLIPETELCFPCKQGYQRLSENPIGSYQ